MKIFTQTTLNLSSHSFTRFLAALSFLFVMFFSGLLQAQTSTALYTFSTNTTGSLALLSDGTTAVDMSTSTTQLVAASNDSAVSALSSIGFTFPLTGSTYTQFYATANGLVTLGATAPSGTTYVTSGGSTTTPRLSAMCADNYVSSTGKVHFKLIGTSPNRCLVIEFLNIATAYLTSATSFSTWQTRLYESGVIEYVYGGMFRQTDGLCGTCTFTNGFSVGTAANQLASITTSSNTSSTASFTSNTYTQGAAITNLNSASNGSRRVYTYTPPPTYTSVAATDWNTASTWSLSSGGNGVPTAGSTVIVNTNVTAATTPTNQPLNITVNSGSTLTLNAAYTNPSGSTITVASGGALALGGTLTNSGTVTVNGTAQINGGGYASTNAFSYAATGSALIMNHNSGLYGISTGQAFWPTANPPFNVTIQGTGAQINNTVGAVAGTLTVNSQLACAATPSVTVSGTAILAAQLSNTANGNFLSNGTLQINAGGYVSTSAPTYGAASTLVYNSGSTSGTPYGVSLEWTGSSATAGVGIPNNVTIQGNTFITMPNGNRGLSAALNVTAGSGITLNATSGDLGIGGNFTQNGTLTHSGRAINFFGTTTTTQTITGTGLNGTGATNCFAYFLNNTTSTGGVTIGVNTTIDGTSGDVLQLLNAGPLKIGAFTLTVNGTGGNLRVNGLTGGVTKVIDFTSASGILLIKGTTNGFTAKTVASTSSGVLSVTSTVAGGQVQVQGGGFDPGSALTTIQTGAFMTINSNGYIATNSPTYATGSTLSFRTGLDYGVGTNDKTWAIGASGAGVPDKVEINATGTNVTISEARTARTSVTVTAGTLTNNTSTLSISTGTSAASAVVINGGTYANGGGTTTIGNSLTTTSTNALTVSSGTLTNSSGTINVVNTGTTASSAVLISGGTYNNSGGTMNIGNASTTVAATGALTISSGSLTNSSGTITIAALNTTASATVVNITGTGTLTNSGGTLNVGPTNGGNQSLTLGGGTLTINNGTVAVNGAVALTTGAFNMSSGNFNIDANSGVSGSSAGATADILGIASAVTGTVNGGTILINDPLFAGTTGRALAYTGSTASRSWAGNTVQFGGATGNASTSTNGFNVDTYVSSVNLQLGNVIANGGAVVGTSRFVSGSATVGNGFDIGGNLTINASSEVRTLSAGTVLRIKGNIINNGTLTDLAGIAFNQRSTTISSNTAAQTVSGSGTFRNLTASPTAKFTNLTFDNTLAAPAAAVTFSIGDVTASGTVTLTNGIIDIGNNNSFNFVGTASAVARTNGYVLIQGTGQMKKDLATGATAFTFHVGENTGTTEYSPYSLSFSANSLARTIGVRVVDATHPNIDDIDVQTDYISRYWQLSNSAAGTYTYTGTASYVAADINGTEGNLKMGLWNGTSPWKQAVSSAASNVLTISTGLTETTGPLSATAEFTGRVKGANTYTWIGGATNTYNTPANWNPSRSVVDATDILVFDGTNINGASGTGAITATAVPAESIGQLKLTGNANVTLQSAAAITLSITGGAGTDLDIPSGSHLQLGSTAANSINLAFTGTQVATIAGQLSLLTNTSNNNTYTVTNSTTTVTGTINSTGVVAGGTTSNLLITTGTYNHNNANAAISASTPAIPTATWGTTSTCAVLGLTSPTAGTFPSGLTGQTFGNFTWNTPSLSTAPNIAGATITATGTFTMTSTGSSELRLGGATNGTIVCANYSQLGGTINCASGAGIGTIRTSGTFNQSGGTITETSTGSGLLDFNGTSSQSVTTGGILANTINVTVSNPTGIAVTGTLPMNAGTTFTAASSGTAVTSGTVTYSTTTTLAYVTAVGTQTTGSEFPATSGPVNLTFNNTFVTTPEVTLSGSRTVTGTLTITAGRVLLGNNDLTLANGGTQTVTTPGATKMIVTNGTGLYKRGIPATTGTYLFPIGDNSGTIHYSPVTLQFTANSAIRIVGAKVTDAASSNLNTGGSPTNYLSRYWTFSENAAGGTYNYYLNPAVAATGAEDENGTASLIKAAYWDGATWTTSTGSYTAGSLVSNATGVSETAGPLGTVEWTGRDAPPVSYTWVGFTDGSWNTATNWSPNGVPISSDTVTLANGSTGAAANLSLTTAVTVNNLTFNGSGNFFSVGASPAAMTVLGTVTYTAGTGTWDATSTFAISSASSQTIPAFAYGNLTGTGGARVWSTGTTGIAGTFTPGAGAYTATAGSTVDYNGAGAQTIGAANYNNLTISGARGTATITLASGTIDVSGSYTTTATGTISVASTGNTVNFSSASSQTIPAFVYNIITNTGNGPRTLASSGTIIIAGTTFTPGSGAYTVTGSTVRFSNATGITIPVLTPAATNNYNNLSVSGAGAYVQGGSLTLGGNFSQTAGTYTVTSGASALTLTVGGSFTQSAGTFNVTGSAATAGATVTVTGATSVFAVNMEANASNTSSTVLFQANGDATFTGSSTTTSFDWMAGGTALTTYDITFGIKGNFNWSNALGRTYVSGSGTPKGFVFNGTGTIAAPQTLTYSGSAITYGGDFTVSAGTVVKLLTNIGIGPNNNPYDVFTVNGTLDTSTFTVEGGATNGTFTLAAGATLRTANPNGVVSTTVGSVSNTIGTRTFNAAANYEFYGTTAIAANFPNTTMNNLTNSSTNTTTQGASITVNGNLALTSGTLASGTNPIALAGNITGSGTHTSSGAGILTMSGASKTISGATLGLLTLNNAAGFSLTGSPTITGNLTFTAGNLDLNGSNNVTLGATATLTGETCSRQFINGGSPSQGNGYIETTRTLAANPGNVASLGLNVQTATAMGSTNIKRFVQKGISSVGLTNSIKRAYSITPTTAASGNVTLTSSYCDGELNGNTESTPALVSYYGTGTDETTGYSDIYGTASNDTTANTVTTIATASLIAGQNNITLANSGPDAYYTVQNGDWNTAATWVLNAVPPAGVATIIKNTVTVNGTVTNAPSSIAINTGKSLTFGASGTITTTTLTNNGSVVMTDGGTITIASGGTFANGTNTFTGGAGTVAFAGTGTITGTTTFNNVTLNNGVNFGTTSTIGATGTLQLNSGGFASNSNSPLFASGSTLKYNAGGGSGAKYNQSFEWPATNGPSNVVIDNNSWVQLTANRSLAGNLTVTNGALQSLGTNSLTMNGTSQAITISKNSGGAIYGTDNAFGNDLSLIVSSGTTTLTGDATSSLDDEKKFLNVTVNAGATLALSRGILCKYGAFTVNGTLQINTNGYVQNDASYSTNAKLPVYNSTTGALTYNNGGPYTNGGEWLSTNSPFNVTIQNNSAVVLSGDRTINGNLTLTAGTLELGTKNLTIGDTGTITASSPSASTMVIASGSGQLRKSFSTTGSFIYPIGDNTGTAEYSPVTLNFTAGTLAGYAGVNITNAKQANNTSTTDYINRFWTVSTSGITSPTCTASFVYANADIVGTESNLYGGRYLSSSWNCMDAVTTATNTISKVITEFGVFTAGEYDKMGCCANPTSGGTVAAAQTICSATAPTAFTSSAAASGQTGILEYKWQSSTTSADTGFNDIASTNSATYTSGALTATTWFKRLSKVTCSGTWATIGESNVIQITITPVLTPTFTQVAPICSGETLAALPTTSNNGIAGSWSPGLNNSVTTTYTFTPSGCGNTATMTITVGKEKTWNAGWTPAGAPTSVDTVLINGNYTASTDGGTINGCTMTVDNNAVVVVDNNSNINLQGKLTVTTGSVTINNNCNLLQSTDIANSGNITVKRNSNALFRLDYTQWSTPVTGSGTLLQFTPLTTQASAGPPVVASRFYVYNSLTNTYNNSINPATTTFEVGKGYHLRMPNNWVAAPLAAAKFTGVFTGVPNNGTKTITMSNTASGKGFNLVGNPYPSDISISSFVAANSSAITGTLYFWRKTNGAATPSYSTWTNGSFNQGNATATNPNGIISVGQGFFVEASSGQTNLSFNNSMRVADNDDHFFRAPSTIDYNRIWLNATNAAGAFCQSTVGYMTGSTDGVDSFDGLFFNDGELNLTSIIGADKYAIQGRNYPFDNNDIVPLSFKATTAGNYSIAIDHVDGLFSGSTDIYLRDNVAGTVNNLTTGAYSFAANAGLDDTRFELLYRNVLATTTNELTDNNVFVFKANNAININSGKTNMENVKVFDIRGRLLAEKTKVNATTLAIDSSSFANQVLIVTITSTDGVKVSKKIVN